MLRFSHGRGDADRVDAGPQPWCCRTGAAAARLRSTRRRRRGSASGLPRRTAGRTRRTCCATSPGPARRARAALCDRPHRCTASRRSPPTAAPQTRSRTSPSPRAGSAAAWAGRSPSASRRCRRNLSPAAPAAAPSNCTAPRPTDRRRTRRRGPASTLSLSFGTPGDLRYLRNVLREIPSSRAIARTDQPLPCSSYSSLTNPPSQHPSCARPVMDFFTMTQIPTRVARGSIPSCCTWVSINPLLTDIDYPIRFSESRYYMQCTKELSIPGKVWVEPCGPVDVWLWGELSTPRSRDITSCTYGATDAQAQTEQVGHRLISFEACDSEWRSGESPGCLRERSESCSLNRPR